MSNRREQALELVRKSKVIIAVEQRAALTQQGIAPEVFAEATGAALLANPDIFNCDELSVLRAIRTSCQFGMLPDGREGAIVPFKNTAQFVPMKEGLQRMFVAATKAKLSSGVIYENDKYDVVLGTDASISVTPLLVGDRGPVIAAWALAAMPDGERHIRVMTRDDLRKVEDTSRARNGPWKTWPERMQEKAAVKSLLNGLLYLVPKDRSGAIKELIDGDGEHATQVVDTEPERDGGTLEVVSTGGTGSGRQPRAPRTPPAEENAETATEVAPESQGSDAPQSAPPSDEETERPPRRQRKPVTVEVQQPAAQTTPVEPTPIEEGAEPDPDLPPLNEFVQGDGDFGDGGF